MITPTTATPAFPVLEVPVAEMLAVIHDLTSTLAQSTATTHHQLEQILAPILEDERLRHVHSGCEIIFRNISKEFGKIIAAEHEHPMRALARHCEALGRRWREGPAKIQWYLQPFLQRAKSVLVHGHSAVLCDALLQALAVHRLRLFFTEGLPFRTGERSVEYMRGRLESLNGAAEISDSLVVVPDSAVSAVLPSVGFVLVGTSAVTINGGAVGMVGCNQLAVLANALGKDFYVAAEVFRFSRTFPLSSGDVRPIRNDLGLSGGEEGLPYPLLDFVPPSRISMFFTNLGLFPPATAADELYSIFMGDCEGGDRLLVD